METARCGGGKILRGSAEGWSCAPISAGCAGARLAPTLRPRAAATKGTTRGSGHPPVSPSHRTAALRTARDGPLRSVGVPEAYGCFGPARVCSKGRRGLLCPSKTALAFSQDASPWEHPQNIPRGCGAPTIPVVRERSFRRAVLRGGDRVQPKGPRFLPKMSHEASSKACPEPEFVPLETSSSSARPVSSSEREIRGV